MELSASAALAWVTVITNSARYQTADAVQIESRISTADRRLFNECLRDQQSVERISVMERQCEPDKRVRVEQQPHDM